MTFDTLHHLLPQMLFAVPIIGYAYLSFIAIDQSFRVPVYFFGWYAWASGPGPRLIPWGIFQPKRPISIRYTVIDVVIEGVLTKNKIPLKVSVVITIKVDPDHMRNFMVNIGDRDYKDMVKSQAEAATVSVIRNDDYDTIMSDRELFKTHVREQLEKLILDWGIIILNVEAGNIEVTDKNIADAFTREVIANALGDAEAILVAKLKALAPELGMTVGEYRRALLPLQMDGKGNVFYPTDAFKLPQLNELPGGARNTSAAPGATRGTS